MSELRFIVVDDHMLMRKTLSQYLRELGYDKIDVAINGKDAMEKIGAKVLVGESYDIAFIDMNMPVMDGMELLRACRNNKSLDKTALVMLTGECERQKVIEAMKAGVTSYIIKPISKTVLAEKMANILKWLEEKRGTANG